MNGILPGEPDFWPAPGDPMGVARRLLAGRTALGAYYTLRHWRGGWHSWTGTHWPEVETAEISQWVYAQLEEAKYQHQTKDGPEPRMWRPNRSRVGDVLDALAKLVLVPASTDAPTWLPDIDGTHRRDGAAVERLIPVRNGLLEVKGDKRTLGPRTPGLFNLYALPFDYNAKAPEPTKWWAFLGQLWPGEPDAIAALQEWFGYVLSGRTDLQKILLLVGPPRSGKGTIARVLAALVGKGNHASPTLASLGTNFGLSPLIGRPLAIVSDARLSRKADVATITERLLSVSGEDAQTVDRKYRDPWTGTLGTRFMVLSNELPRLGIDVDPSQLSRAASSMAKIGQGSIGQASPAIADAAQRLTASADALGIYAHADSTALLTSFVTLAVECQKAGHKPSWFDAEALAQH